MLLKFLCEYTDEHNFLIRDFSKIAMRYLRGDFFIDFLLLIPVNAILSFRYSRLFFLVKCYRIIGVFALIKQEVLMSHVKAYYNRRLARIVKIEELKNNIDIDQNKVDEII
jgi:hypothetical protein